MFIDDFFMGDALIFILLIELLRVEFIVYANDNDYNGSGFNILFTIF